MDSVQHHRGVRQRLPNGCSAEHPEKIIGPTMEIPPTNPTRVVVQCGPRIIKGFLDSPSCYSIEELLRDAPQSPSDTFRVRLLDSDVVQEIPIRDIKAVFYVDSFDGNSDRKDLSFHTRAPIFPGVWMRFQFNDGEVMEGIVYNSIRYLVDPGFFVLPTDPGSNNKLVYVAKTALADHRILGLRKLESCDFR